MSTKHSIAAARFIANRKQEAWHDETLWMVRAKRDKMSHSLPEWERLRELACDIKLYSNSHLDTLLEEFEKNATANGAIVHWAKDAAEHNEIVEKILQQHNAHTLIKSKSMLTEECDMNNYLFGKGYDIIESDLGERILQWMHLLPSHIVLPAIHIKREEVGEMMERVLGTEKGNFDPTYLTHAVRKNMREKFLTADVAMTGANLLRPVRLWFVPMKEMRIWGLRSLKSILPRSEWRRSSPTRKRWVSLPVCWPVPVQGNRLLLILPITVNRRMAVSSILLL